MTNCMLEPKRIWVVAMNQVFAAEFVLSAANRVFAAKFILSAANQVFAVVLSYLKRICVRYKKCVIFSEFVISCRN